jgi:transposase-like protein
LKYQTKRTKPKYIAYSLYLYFLDGLSYRNTVKALQRFVHRSHVSIWKWIQKYRPKRILTKRKKIDEFIIDETLIRVGSQYVAGCGLQLSLRISKSFRWIYPLIKQCLL